MPIDREGDRRLRRKQTEAAEWERQKAKNLEAAQRQEERDAETLLGWTNGATRDGLEAMFPASSASVRKAVDTAVARAEETGNVFDRNLAVRAVRSVEQAVREVEHDPFGDDWDIESFGRVTGAIATGVVLMLQFVALVTGRPALAELIPDAMFAGDPPGGPGWVIMALVVQGLLAWAVIAGTTLGWMVWQRDHGAPRRAERYLRLAIEQAEGRAL